VVDSLRARLVLGVTALYLVRHGITLFYLLKRRVAWSEAIGLGCFLILFEVGFCVLAAGMLRSAAAPIGGVDYIAIALVLVGSFLNTYSEMQRKWWKDKPENKGRCYTRGLFGLSMHINYFGDTVLFAGWSILTATLWTLVLPVLMGSMFVFYHIPGLDSYLEQRYGDEFREYRKRTKKFIPFVY
jgi:steroid 5-alpha reductase family enzyme